MFLLRTNSLHSCSKLVKIQISEDRQNLAIVVNRVNSSLCDQQRMEKLEFLRDQSRKLDKLLESVRSDRISQIEFLMLSTSSTTETLTLEEKETIHELMNQIQSLRTQNLCLNYLVNIYEGKIPLKVIDLLPPESSSKSSASAENFILNSRSLSNIPHLGRANHPILSDSVSNGGPFTRSISEDTCPSPTEQENQDLSPINLELAMIEFVSDDYLVWICPACTFKNHPEIAICEMCETRKRNPSSSNS